jgi:oxygen-independent coproporphyrinogen-3 oxidase
MTAMTAPATRRSDGDLLLALQDARAPRYTSYPTAVQFDPAVGADRAAEWLGGLDPAQAVSLYVHIPFCSRLCWYCGCNTRVANRAQTVSDYVGWLIRELALVEQALGQSPRVRFLHLGGGTPNMLSRDDMTRLFAALRHVFRISPGAEIAAEIDPAVLTRDWVRAAAFHGLTRASLGVQNLSPAVQAAVNRPEAFSVIAEAVGWLREAQIPSINLDLMYGLPHQTVADVRDTLDAVLTLRPERIALFGYAHVPWMKANQQLIDESALPGPAERIDQSESAAEQLTAEGYVRIGMDHFALPEDDLARAQAGGTLRRNFQGYTTDTAQALIGLGVSAISRLPQGYLQNSAAETSWRAALKADRLPVARGLVLTDDDRFRGEIIERLMCAMTVDLAEVCRRHGRALADLAGSLQRIEAMNLAGMTRYQDGRLTITPAGRLVVRSICTAFDAHLDIGAVRHARAV